MLFDWTTEAICVLNFRSIQERWGVWGIIWLLAGALALVGVVTLVFSPLR